jgi:Predicted Zn-dependent hydrolases of the beta-lactamase fold
VDTKNLVNNHRAIYNGNYQRTKITLIGHAAILVEMRGATWLMDPVFNDPFEEGAVVSCPKRKVYLDRMPKPHILIISHRHPDHFDIPSLAQVLRDCDAICPADLLIVYEGAWVFSSSSRLSYGADPFR